MSDKGSPPVQYQLSDSSGPVPSPGQVALSVTVATTPPQAATPGPPPMTPPSSSAGGTPQAIPSPQPDPNPPPPRISAAELALLTESAATKNGTFQCTLCHKQFGYKNGLIRHVRLTHVGEKPYQCNICQRRFGYKHILMEHQNLHFGNRPYACNMCDKKFAARSNLIQHRMVHKRPFNCTMCSKRFDREDQLKKHMFAHPQSMLTCNTCKYNASSQTDLNKHMLEKHQPESQQIAAAAAAHAAVMAAAASAVAQAKGQQQQNAIPAPMDTTPNGAAPPTNGKGSPDHGGVNGLKTEVEEPLRVTPEDLVQRQTEPITPPDSGEDFPQYSQSLSPSAHFSPGRQTLLEAAARGQRIDAICHQLSTSHAPGFVNPYHGVIVKKEAGEETMYPDRQGQLQLPQTTVDYTLPPASVDLTRASLTPSSTNFNHASSAPTTLSSIIPPPIPSVPPVSALGLEDKPQLPTSAALPGIHEVFSRRAQKLPPFGNFGVPLLTAATDNRLPINVPPELTLSMMSPPPTSFPLKSGESQNQRPTAQLPPITQVLKQTKDQAVQHSAPIPGFPSLDDVLSYYQSQGKLFKCQHCNILFFERGMYFLHASLHGPSNPWECSICHKICSDKNEFTLHFVNQQHNS